MTPRLFGERQRERLLDELRHLPDLMRGKVYERERKCGRVLHLRQRWTAAEARHQMWDDIVLIMGKRLVKVRSSASTHPVVRKEVVATIQALHQANHAAVGIGCVRSW